MNRRDSGDGRRGARMQWGSFGFVAGIVLGVLLGWFFAGFIGAFVRVAVVAMALIPLILLFIAWRKFISPILRPRVEQGYGDQLGVPHDISVIETRAVVHSGTRETLPR